MWCFSVQWSNQPVQNSMTISGLPGCLMFFRYSNMRKPWSISWKLAVTSSERSLTVFILGSIYISALSLPLRAFQKILVFPEHLADPSFNSSSSRAWCAICLYVLNITVQAIGMRGEEVIAIKT